MAGLQVNETITLGEDELEERFIHSPGPGGQHVNKAATGVQLRFDLTNSPSLPAQVRERLKALAGKRLNKDGILVIEAHNHRSLERNRREARRRLLQMVRTAAHIPRHRIRSGVPRAASEKRLEYKRRRSDKKRNRRPVEY